MNPDRIALQDWKVAAAETSLLEAISAVSTVEARHVAAWRKHASADVVAAAIDVVRARRSAADRLEDAETLIADADGAQQATPAILARWKAQRIAAAAPGAMVVDCGCGIGADTRMLAQVSDVSAIERSVARAWMAQCYSGVAVSTETTTDYNAVEGVLHLDPGRRDDAGARLRDPTLWSPGLEALQSIWTAQRDACIMLGPGVHLDECALPEDVQVSFCSIDRTLTDAAAWSGTLALHKGQLEAVGLSSDGVVRLLHGHPGVPPGGPPPAAGLVLHVPDPALERARLLDQIAEAHDLWEPATGLGLLLGRAAADDAWLQPWTIEGVASPREDAMAAWLKDHDGGTVTVRTRGAATSDADALSRRLSGRGSTPWTVWILRLGRQKTALMTSQTG